MTTSTSANPSSAEIVDQAVLGTYDFLTAFATDPAFTTKFSSIFGDSFDVKQVEALRQEWLDATSDDLPAIELRSAADLNGAKGAFATATNTIYLSQDFVQNATAPQAIVNVLLEEFGHFVDAKVNQIDTPGDEGEIFSALVQGHSLSDQQWQQLKTENDAVTITVEGQTLSAEAAASGNLGLLATKVNGLIQRLKTTLEPLVPDTSSLPLVGNKLQLKEKFNETFNNLQSQVDKALENAEQKGVAGIKTGLFNALNGAGLLLDSADAGTGISDSDIIVNDNAKEITFDFKIGKKFAPNFSTEGESFGLPALGFNLEGGISANVNFEFDVGFGVDDSTNDEQAVFLKTLPASASNANEFRANLAARLRDQNNKPIEFSGNLGFLNLTATDTTPTNKNNINGNFEVDFKDPNNDGRIRLSEITNVSVDPTPVTASANLDLKLDTGVGSSTTKDTGVGGVKSPVNAEFPSVTANFKLDGLKFNSDATDKLTKPSTLAFNDVKLDLGSFVSNFGKTVFGKLQTITDPLSPIVNTLRQPLPIINSNLIQLAESAAQGGLFGKGTIGPETLSFVDDIAKVIALVDSFPINPGNLTVEIGSFNLNGQDATKPGTVLNPQQNAADKKDPLTQLSSGNNDITLFLNSLVELVKDEPSDQKVQALAPQNALALGPEDVADLKKHIPILAEPTSIFNVLLGKQVTLFQYDTPKLDFAYTYTPPGINIFGPIELQFEGTVKAGAQLSVGYDTKGLKDFREKGTPLSLLDGFFAARPTIDTNKDGKRDNNLELGGLITAAVEADIKFAKIAVGGGIGLTVGFNLGKNLNALDQPDDNDKNQFDPNDFKIRGSDIAKNITSPFCLFTPSGELAAIIFGQLTLDLGFFSFSKRLDLANIKLVEFTLPTPCADTKQDDHYNVEDPAPPKEDSPLGKELLAQGIINRKATDNKDVITVEHLGGDLNGDPSNPANTSTEKIKVTGLDPAPGKEYDKVKLIILSAGAGDDTIKFINGVQAAGQVKGGKGNDTIITGNGNDFLTGGEGNDILDGGGSSDNTADYSSSTSGAIVNLAFDLASGTGKATNDGFGGQDTLKNIQNVMGSNSTSSGDVLTGTDGKNVFQAGKGNDKITAGKGNDVLLGELGADTMDGGEGEDTTTYIGSKNKVFVNLSNTDVSFDSPIDQKAITLLANQASGGEANGDKLSNIENITGSDFNDIIVSSDTSGDHHVSGLGGDDILVAGQSADILDGSSGNDWVSYQRSTAGVNVNLAALDGAAGGGFASGDELLSLRKQNRDPIADQTGKFRSSIENLQGSKFSDTLKGDVGANILRGEEGSDNLQGDEGNDTLVGGAGGDVLDGGGGIDLADYRETDSPVKVSLLPGAVNTGGHAAGDTFTHNGAFSTVENIRGSDFASQFNFDILTGDAGNNDIDPGLSSFGTDVVDGGDGNDRLILDYSGAILSDGSTGVNGGVDSSFGSDRKSGSFSRKLGSGIRDGVDFSNIERLKVIGTSKKDSIVGGDGDDVILSGDGDDFISGHLGSNTIKADDGNDFVVDQSNFAEDGFSGGSNSLIDLDGGRGVDTLRIDLSSKSGRIALVNTTDPTQENPNQLATVPDGTVSIKNFEIFREIRTGTGKDTLIQLGKEDNIFRTGGGDDIVNAGLGNDFVNGGVGGDDLLVIDYSVGDTGTGISSDLISDEGESFGKSYSRGTGSGQGDVVRFGDFERFNITGTKQADQLEGGNNKDFLIGKEGSDTLTGNGGDDLLRGGLGNDVLNGGDGNDTLNGADPTLNSPQFLIQVDTLTGGLKVDRFVLGDQSRAYYDDGNSTTDSFGSRAIINDFKAAEGDVIQLNGAKENYSLITGTSTVIRLNGPSGSTPDVIGVVQGVTGLSLNSSSFSFV